MKIGENIKKFRKVKGLTQVELAQASGVTQNNISRYESGEVLPQIESIAKIAKALSVPFIDLLPENAGIEVEVKDGCDFCNGTFIAEIGDCHLTIKNVPVLVSGEMERENCLNVYINEHGENGSKNHYELMVINYCPMCGKKLVE